MSQHDYIISNDTGANVRSDLNNALGAIATVNSGATEPTTTYAYQLWMDTANNVLKMRNSANSAWYTLPISPVANNTVDINGGTIDGATIATSDITVGAGKTLDVSAGTLTLANDQISGDAINGGTIGSVAITSADINGGTIDGVTIGGSSAGAGTFTNLTATGTVTLNQSTIDGLTVGQGAGNVATNTAVGKDALDANTTGGNNTAVGQDALGANTTANHNTAVGYGALYDNTTGGNNIAVGNFALTNNTTAESNVGVGYGALETNTTGSYNTALGQQALVYNTTASNNTAVGYQAGYSNTTGVGSVAIGYQAGYAMTTGGSYSTLVGWSAGIACTGAGNTLIGGAAGYALTTGANNTFIGNSANNGSGGLITTGSKNTIIGNYNGNQGGLDIRTASNNIVLSDGDGNPRLACDSTGQWQARSSVAGTALEIYNASATNPYGINIVFTGASPDNNTVYFLNAGDSSVNRFRVWSDGDVVNHDNSYGAISDIKLKEQITDASSQWDDIKALSIRKYKMKSDVAEKGDSDEHWRLGVIAQEVEAAGMSGLIKTSPDMIENEDGEQVESGEYTKQVKYSILYMKAVKALQEAMERIEILEAKVAALETP